MTSQEKSRNMSLFITTLENWRTIETIIDSSSTKNVSTHFLQLKNFPRLTNLQLACNIHGTINPQQRLERAEALVNAAIHNAP